MLNKEVRRNKNGLIVTPNQFEDLVTESREKVKNQV